MTIFKTFYAKLVIDGIKTGGSLEYYNPLTEEEYSDNKKNVSVGSHGYTTKLAKNKLKEMGVNPEIDQHILTGISYVGDEYPIGVRFHLDSEGKNIDPSKIWLIYSHYEKKFGKDVSWTKVVPVKIINQRSRRMSSYYWDEKMDYLMRTRDLYYNDDYLEFLVKSVWKIKKPVKIVDFGCGYGYMGLKLMPLLPAGSSYTGLDMGETGSLIDRGRIACSEPHWISCMSSYYHGVEQSEIVKLGRLQRLFEQDAKSTGKDGNVGIKIPYYLSQLGLTDIECRASDKVVFLDPQMEKDRNKRFDSITMDGFGSAPGDRNEFINGLIERGLSSLEAQDQYETEAMLSDIFSKESALMMSAGMKITTGVKK